jgi:hypothetical protein
LSLHARAKTMHARPAPFFWLISPLDHWQFSPGYAAPLWGKAYIKGLYPLG